MIKLACDFSRANAETLVRNCRQVLRFAGQDETPEKVIRIVRSLPQAEELSDPTLEDRSFMVKTLIKAADGANTDSIIRPEVDQLATYFLDDLPRLDSSTRDLLKGMVIGAIQGLIL